MNKDCIFCKIVASELPSYQVYEDDKVMAFLDINPINAGHTLLIPKKHADNTLELSDEILGHMAIVAKKITPAILQAVNADSWNLGANNGATAGQVVFHAHWHIIPRFTDDKHHLWEKKDDVYSDKAIEQVASQIRKNIK